MKKGSSRRGGSPTGHSGRYKSFSIKSNPRLPPQHRRRPKAPGNLLRSRPDETPLCHLLGARGGKTSMFLRATTLWAVIDFLPPWYAAWICSPRRMLNITNRGLCGCCRGLPARPSSFSLNRRIGKQTGQTQKGRGIPRSHGCRAHIYLW